FYLAEVRVDRGVEREVRAEADLQVGADLHLPGPRPLTRIGFALLSFDTGDRVRSELHVPPRIHPLDPDQVGEARDLVRPCDPADQRPLRSFAGAREVPTELHP